MGNKSVIGRRCSSHILAIPNPKLHGVEKGILAGAARKGHDVA